MEVKSLLQIVADISPYMQCNCDLDNWQPELSTGHSWVCRIHKKAIRTQKEQRKRQVKKLCPKHGGTGFKAYCTECTNKAI